MSEPTPGGGADPKFRDSKHDSDAIGWAEHGADSRWYGCYEHAARSG
ncbi:MAG: hypothetical protein JWM41_4928 [Gemmatimonadetes bacterium]|nr:hypothetical protein [Gemmatimonadota bacterium]